MIFNSKFFKSLNPLGEDSLVIFFSVYKEAIHFCAVRAISRLLITRIGNYFNLESQGKHSEIKNIEFCFDISNNCSFTDHLILFSHPSKNKKGFLCDNGIIFPEWWKNTKYKVKFIFAHTCQGADILKENEWRNIFEFWVSFKGNITLTIGEVHHQKIIGSLFSRLSRRLQKTDSETEFYQTIKEEYLKAIFLTNKKEMSDKGKAAFCVLLPLLNDCYEKLVCSYDVNSDGHKPRLSDFMNINLN